MYMQTPYTADSELDQLQHVHQEWVATLDSIRDPLFVFNGSGKVVRCNKAYICAAEMAFPSILGTPYWRVFPKLDEPLTFEPKLDIPDSRTREQLIEVADRKFSMRTFPFDSRAANSTGYTVCVLEDRTLEFELQREIEKSKESTVANLIDLIGVVSNALDFRDPYTSKHQQQVANLSRAIASSLNMTSSEVQGVYLGALIHDIGKICIPSEILHRPGKLTSAEFEIIKSHPKVGYEIIKNVEFPWPIKEIVLGHHERLDGSGYPNGWRDEEISLSVRIIAVADVIDAISSHRPYRPALGLNEAIKIVTELKGTHYDPIVVECCCDVINGGKYDHFDTACVNTP